MKNISSEPAEMLSNLAIHQHADLLKGTQPKKQILWKHMVNGTQELFFSLMDSWQAIAGISQIKLEACREFVDGSFDRA